MNLTNDSRKLVSFYEKRKILKESQCDINMILDIYLI